MPTTASRLKSAVSFRQRVVSDRDDGHDLLVGFRDYRRGHGQGRSKRLAVMIAAVIIAVIVMLIFSETISRFVERHPTLKMLALSFLILIGVMLVAEGIGTHINKGYIYFAMAFSLVLEFLNMRVARHPWTGQCNCD